MARNHEKPALAHNVACFQILGKRRVKRACVREERGWSLKRGGVRGQSTALQTFNAHGTEIGVVEAACGHGPGVDCASLPPPTVDRHVRRPRGVPAQVGVSCSRPPGRHEHGRHSLNTVASVAVVVCVEMEAWNPIDRRADIVGIQAQHRAQLSHGRKHRPHLPQQRQFTSFWKREGLEGKQGNKKKQQLPRSAASPDRAAEERQGQDGGALSMPHLQGRQAARCTTGACVWRARVRAIPCVRARQRW